MPEVDSVLFSKEFIESHIIKPNNGHFESFCGDRIEAKFGKLILKSESVNIVDFSVIPCSDYLVRLVSIDNPIVQFQNALEVVTLDELLAKVDNGPAILTKINERITLFNDIAAELDVPKLQVDVQKLLADAHLLVSSLNESEVFETMKAFLITSWDSLYILIEKYVMFHVYDMVFFKVCQAHKEKDQALFEIISKCEDAVLGASFSVDLQRATSIFQRLATLRSPLDKIACFSDTITILTEENIGSDDLLPLIILTVLKSKIINLASNLQFIIEFSFEKEVTSGKTGYILSTFEAVISYLLENQEYLHENSIFHSTFKLVLRSGSVERVREFLLKKSKPKFVDEKLAYFCDDVGNDAMALSLEYPPLVEYFASIGYSVNHQNFLGETCLHIAATQNLLAIVPTLFKLKANLYLRNRSGHTPFSLAVSKGNLNIAKSLYPVKSSLTRLLPSDSIFSYVNSVDTLKYLFELGLSPDSIVKNKPLILYFCLQKRNDICVFMLKSTEMNCKARDDNHCGLMHYCAMIKELLPVAKALLQIYPKFAVDAADLFGNTALHLAVKFNNLKLIEFLLLHSAKIEILNSNNKAPIDYASLPEIVNTLTKHSMQMQLKSQPLAIFITYSKANSKTDYWFDIKSAKALETEDDVVIVKRSLHDFGFFRSMLVKEHPEAFMCDIADLLAVKKADAGEPSQRGASKICKRLQTFLWKLLDTKKFQTDELVWEFLQAYEFDHTSVQERVVMKAAFLEEIQTDSFSHEVVNLSDSLNYWKQAIQNMETTVGLERRCGTLSRKYLAMQGQYFKELMICSYYFSFGMGIQCRFTIGFRRMFDLMKGENCEAIKRFSSVLQEPDYLLTGGMDSIAYLMTLADEYQALQQHLNLLTSEIDKKTAIAKSHPTSELLKDIDKAFASFSKLSHNFESRGAKLNFVINSLQGDLQILKREHAKQLEDLLDSYVDQNLKSGEELIFLLSDLL